MSEHFPTIAESLIILDTQLVLSVTQAHASVHLGLHSFAAHLLNIKLYSLVTWEPGRLGFHLSSASY